jgi:hypothetical protein
MLFVIEVLFIMILLLGSIYIADWKAEEKVKMEMADIIEDIENLEKSGVELRNRLDKVKKELEKY